MKKTFLAVSLFLVSVLFLACGGGGGPDKEKPDKEKPDKEKNEKIISVKMIENYGYTALFEIEMDFSSLPAGRKFVSGQSAPDSTWIEYKVIDPGKICVVWPKGQYFEFSYGTENHQGAKNWMEPSGKYAYPEGALPTERRFRIKLGEVEYCQQQNIKDALITGIHKIGSGNWRIYLNYFHLPIRNYQKLFVFGQSAPDSKWIEYPVTDAYPCYYFEIFWPSSQLPFEFSFGVVREDGQEQWVDPTHSFYNYRDHLAISL